MLDSRYLADEPDGTGVISSIEAAIVESFSITVGQRHGSYLSFKIEDSPFFSIRATGERKSAASSDWESGKYNWNGRWKVELMMGSLGDRSKTWRPAAEKLDEIHPKIVEVVRGWLSDVGSSPTDVAID